MRDFFSINPNLIYLNNGTHSFCPKNVLAAVHSHYLEYEKNPTVGLFQAWRKMWDVQCKIALHFNANPMDIFLRQNVTQPLNEFILGVDLPKNSEILTTNQEYGAIFNVCRFRAEKENLRLRKIVLPDKKSVHQMTKQKYLDLILSSLNADTKMLVLSEVYTGHGLVLPIFEIAQETRRRNICLVVDGAHAPGFMKVDFNRYRNVDFYAGNLHKWFMGPKGTGFGWIHENHKKSFKQIQAGWTTYNPQEPFTHFANGDIFAMKMLMQGCHDFSGFFALKETLDFWHGFGERPIFKRIRELGIHLAAVADKELKLMPFRSDDEAAQGPLYAYLLPDRFQRGSYEKLMNQILKDTGVQVAITQIDDEMYLRLSAHVYNEIDEISDGIKRLSRFFNT